MGRTPTAFAHGPLLEVTLLTGQLRDRPLPVVLHQLFRERFTGEMGINTEFGFARAYFRQFIKLLRFQEPVPGGQCPHEVPLVDCRFRYLFLWPHDGSLEVA